MKSDKATTARRVEHVLELRTLGASFYDIRQFASEQAPPWNVSDRQIWRYIESSDKLLERTLEKDRAKLANRHLAQRRALYARTMATSDYKTALAVLRDEADLLHLYDQPSKPGGASDQSTMNSGDVVKVLAGQLREIDSSELSTAEKSRLTATLADSLLRAIGINVLDERLEALQAVLLGRKDAKG